MEPSRTDSTGYGQSVSLSPALLEYLAAPTPFGCEAALECEWQSIAHDDSDVGNSTEEVA